MHTLPTQRNFMTGSATASERKLLRFFLLLIKDYNLYSLRGKYKKLKATFSSTGTGVMPDGGTQMKNLLGESSVLNFRSSADVLL
jgi:hypothetical protein